MTAPDRQNDEFPYSLENARTLIAMVDEVRLAHHRIWDFTNTLPPTKKKHDFYYLADFALMPQVFEISELIEEKFPELAPTPWDPQALKG